MKLIISIICIILAFYNYLNKRIISSSTLWIFCYFLIFVVFPKYSDVSVNNEKLIDTYALIGIIFFSIGNWTFSKVKINSNGNSIRMPSFRKSFIFSIISFMLFIIYLLYKTGSNGINSILTSEVTAKQLALSEEHALGNLLSTLMLLPIPFILSTIMSSESKKQAKKGIILFLIFTIITILFSFTRLFFICTLLILILHGIRYFSPKKQLVVILVSILLLTFFMVIMNFIRNFGTANIYDFSDMVKIEYIFESTDFGASYIWFSKLIEIKPPFIFPVSYLKTLFVFIPRSIWNSKPNPISFDILKLIDPYLLSTGYTTAGNSVLGEGYAVLGHIGIFIYPLIWGAVCAYMDKKYYYKLSVGEDDSIWIFNYYLFTTFIIISSQRGDWSQYLPIIFWVFILPLYLLSVINLNRSKLIIKT